jgi:hypothetical protein
MRLLATRILLSLFLLLESAMAAEWTAPFQQGRGQLRGREERKLRWGLHDGLFYNVVLAADYISVQGDISIQESSSLDDGLPYVAYLDAGDILTYQAVLQTTGKYSLKLRIASPFGEGGIQLRNPQNDSQIYASIDTLPASGDWNSWQTVEATFELLSLKFDLNLVVVEAGYNLLWLSLELLEETDSTAKLSEPPVTAPDVEPPPTTSHINSTCMVSLGADEYTTADEGARLSPENNTLELNTSSWAVYSIQVPADGKYIWQMRMTLTTLTGTLNLTNAETEDLYASIKESTLDSWRDINVVLLMAAGMHNVKIHIVEGTWTLSSVCLDEIDFENVHYLESININTRAPTIFIEATPTIAPMVSLNDPSTATMTPTSSAKAAATSAPTVTSSQSNNSKTMTPTTPTEAAPTSTPVVTYSESSNAGIMSSASPTKGAPKANPTSTASSYTGTMPPTSPIEDLPTMAPVVVTMKSSITSTMAPTSSLQLFTTAPSVEAPTQAMNSSQPEAPAASSNDTTSLESQEIAFQFSADEASSMYGAVLEEASSENAACITQLDAFDWVRYPMSTIVGGNYTMEIRVSSASGKGAFDLIDYGTGITYTSMETIPATGEGNWETVSINVTLPEGDVHLMIRVREGGWMYTWIRFSENLAPKYNIIITG